MTTINNNHPILAEQLMLGKMQSMQELASPAFKVTANPLDQAQPSSPISFSSAISQVLDVVNDKQVNAADKMTAVETGQSDDLVGAMIAGQKASLSFSALIQVRNKVVSSFDDILKMPV